MKVCRHCSRDVKLKVSDDIVFHFHWVGEFYVFDAVLLAKDACDARKLPFL